MGFLYSLILKGQFDLSMMWVYDDTLNQLKNKKSLGQLNLNTQTILNKVKF